MRKDSPFHPRENLGGGSAGKHTPGLVGEIGALIKEGETVFKDGLRGARHVFRQGALRGAAGDPVSRGVTEIARALDDVLTRAERTARKVIRPGADERDPAVMIARFPDILEGTEPELRRGLVETQYQLAKMVLEQWGVADALILEQAIRGGVQRFVGEERVLLAASCEAIRDGDAAAKAVAVCNVAAAMALVLAEEEPVRALGRPSPRTQERSGAERDLPGFLRHGASLPTFLAVGLALSGYAGRSSASSEARDFLPSAAAIVEGRFERLSQCRTASELAAAYQLLIPAMP